MISGTITITSVDYENSFQSLLPKLIQKSKTVENPGMAVRFLNKMGDDSLPIVLKIMAHMSDAEKEKLLLVMLDSNQVQINEALNKFLENRDFGNAIQIGEIHAVKMVGTEGFSLVVTGVKIDYDILLKTELVSLNIDSYADMVAEKFGVKGAGLLKNAAKFALHVGAEKAPGMLEQKAIALLNKEENNGKVLNVLKEGLEKIGLYLTVKDIVLMQVQEEQPDSNVVDEAVEADKKFRLPESIEESLMDAIVAYLKETGY